MRTWLSISLFLAIGLNAQVAQIKKVPVTATSSASGEEMFKAYCAACHGPSGKGNGPAASALKVPPSDLTQLAHQHGGKYPDTYVVAQLRFAEGPHGSTDMPIWGQLLKSVSGDKGEVDLRIDNLVRYLGSIQAK